MISAQSIAEQYEITWVTACMMVETCCEKQFLNNKDKDGNFHFISLKLAYRRQLVVRVAESTQQVFLTAQGQGEDPQLEFCPSLLELGPCLPASTEVEAEVTVRNPCSFPIELYSLELDTQYLEEEKVAPFFSRNKVTHLFFDIHSSKARNKATNKILM